MRNNSVRGRKNYILGQGYSGSKTDHFSLYFIFFMKMH